MPNKYLLLTIAVLVTLLAGAGKYGLSISKKNAVLGDRIGVMSDRIDIWKHTNDALVSSQRTTDKLLKDREKEMAVVSRRVQDYEKGLRHEKRENETFRAWADGPLPAAVADFVRQLTTAPAPAGDLSAAASGGSDPRPGTTIVRAGDP